MLVGVKSTGRVKYLTRDGLFLVSPRQGLDRLRLPQLIDSQQLLGKGFYIFDKQNIIISVSSIAPYQIIRGTSGSLK